MTINLEEIKKRFEAATPGPWNWAQCYELDGLHWALENPESRARGMIIDASLVLDLNYYEWLGTPFDEWPNADFIAHAREDIPALVAEVERLRAALKFYADLDSWDNNMIDIGVGLMEEPQSNEAENDHGNIARRALEGEE